MSFILYFAGQGYNQIIDYIKQRNGAKLFTNDGERKWIEKWAEEKKEGKINNLLFVDSGAYTAFTKGKTIDIDDYIDFVNSLSCNVDHFANLDVIPGKLGFPLTRDDVEKAASESFKNFTYIRKRTMYPRRCLPVFHQGEDFKWLEKMLSYQDECGNVNYICLGGSADKPTVEREAWYRKVFAYLEDRGRKDIKLHCLGCSSVNSLSKFPFYSADATSWARAAAFGRIYTKFGNVLVSGVQDNQPDHIKMDEIGLPVLKEYVKKRGFDLNDMMYDNPDKGTKANIERMRWNVDYLIRWAEDYVYMGPKSFAINKLFRR